MNNAVNSRSPRTLLPSIKPDSTSPTTRNPLPSPALSPVIENGWHGKENGLDSHLNGNEVKSNDPARTDGLRDVKARVEEQIHESPRKSSAEAAQPLKLSPAKIFELTSEPESLPLRAATPIIEEIPLLSAGDAASDIPIPSLGKTKTADLGAPRDGDVSPFSQALQQEPLPLASVRATPGALANARPTGSNRSSSSPLMRRKQSSVAPRNPLENGESQKTRRPTLSTQRTNDEFDKIRNAPRSPTRESAVSPISTVIPLPPLSLPTYLQLELSSDRPSPLYIYRSPTADFTYESSRIKFERLLNFLLLPPQLEQILWFGALACLDAWLYTFTILPLRFFKALLILMQWCVRSLAKEAKDIAIFIYTGLGRVWQRQRQASVVPSRRSSVSETPPVDGPAITQPLPRLDLRSEDFRPKTQRSAYRDRGPTSAYRHRRSKSTPSTLLPSHKADLLQGLLIILSCVILLRFDASRMYHSIRGQAAIKLYVIYNALEVFDRLFSALGQDVLECLFSRETLERKPNGRSKLLRPMWMFMLALVYNVLHATALFYQVITLNVAVNSYSNALLTLLMSNQFVEIKGTVFKKFEKENLFQLTCADIVERFQLWLMLLIIALRNIVEVGGLTFTASGSSSPAPNPNTTSTPNMSILPQAFTFFPQWSGQVFGPFLVVLGSEMLVDWLKHAYINKFNSVKPDLYGRFLDVFAKDYYSHAFVDQNLTKRLGLPILPLACLFIRASVQTYHMFIATAMPPPIASTATALAVESASSETSPATTAALAHIDHIFRRALGRSSFGAGGETSSPLSWWLLVIEIDFATMLVFFLVHYLFLLAFKLVLGMCLLSFARGRYKGMKERERRSYDTGGRRVGGWGVTEVEEEKRKWIYLDDEEGLKSLREREAKGKEKAAKGDLKLDGVGRYMMASKRIW